MDNLHGFKMGALLPGLQAVLCGVFFSLVVAGVVLISGTHQAGLYLLLGGSSCAFITWLVLLRHWLRLVDHHAGIQPVQVVDPDPTFEPSTVHIELVETENGAVRGSYLNLPCEPAQLRQLASGVVEGVPLAEGVWCGSGKPFSRSQFHQLRTELVRRGWCSWRNVNAPAQGLQVSHVGRRVFSFLAEGRYHLSAPGEDE